MKDLGCESYKLVRASSAVVSVKILTIWKCEAV